MSRRQCQTLRPTKPSGAALPVTGSKDIVFMNGVERRAVCEVDRPH
ncbi:hypothetical protein I547_4039 [Mycobacterium kansasii 824]|nr:hypothetical protein I547_4039 [Mycobacterium kansasii 824]